ncbi:MAG: hypothetical protein RQ833_07520 [Sphingomonadaceae bacterium]|nr:hypothetical protein [Sphingomonadaceae bacterium]
MHERLAGVKIERLPWAEFLRRYDRPGTLFYLDPPCWGSEGDYGDDLFSRADLSRMADQLRALKGRFILSVNDVPEVRELFAGFEMEDVPVPYSIDGGVPTAITRLVIRGGGG